MIIYKRDTGDILKVIPNEIDIQTLYYHFPQEFKENLEGLDIEDYPTPLFQYKVINGELIKRPVEEIKEMQQYGKILTEEERLNILLTPSHQEIQKAENTIEILSTLQEVGVI